MQSRPMGFFERSREKKTTRRKDVFFFPFCGRGKMFPRMAKLMYRSGRNRRRRIAKSLPPFLGRRRRFLGGGGGGFPFRMFALPVHL